MAKAFVVAAPASGSGKTLVTLGLLKAYRQQGWRVASAKVGPDHIDPRFHEQATGQPCYNLDPWAMSPTQLKNLVADVARHNDLLIIEGVMGLFDGPATGHGTTADVARLLNLPILLVVDASHQAQSVAALVHGFTSYQPDLQFAGVLLNRVASPRHASLLTGAMATQSLPLLGCLPRQPHLQMPSRHLGLVQAQENQNLAGFMSQAAATVTETVDLAALLKAAGERPSMPTHRPALLPPPAQRIAVAQDIAFSFAYPHILTGWKEAGAHLQLFSPLADEAPPHDVDFIFLPGGYPELHAGTLARNQTFMTGLRKSTATIYGECGGYMVLGEGLVDAKGVTHPMANLLPVTTSFAERRLQLGYRRLQPLVGPWKTSLMAHEFHYSTIAHEGKADRLFAASDAEGNPLGQIGLKQGRVMGSYAHIICEAA